MFWDQSGRKPTKKHLRDAAMFTVEGSKMHLALAYAMRDCGVTSLRYPYVVKIKELETRHKVAVFELPEWSGETRIKVIKL